MLDHIAIVFYKDFIGDCGDVKSYKILFIDKQNHSYECCELNDRLIIIRLAKFLSKKMNLTVKDYSYLENYHKFRKIFKSFYNTLDRIIKKYLIF